MSEWAARGTAQAALAPWPERRLWPCARGGIGRPWANCEYVNETDHDYGIGRRYTQTHHLPPTTPPTPRPLPPPPPLPNR
ncbi:hypothetical protein E2C01_091479 [Portunus trituberculatus]|uniref:Uncharacterized protein n=1 Tax=Portunus trituberculatus TaxID=210409 RepID=A0A5B7JV52_PORTR|nr:hypothetical protein [Portunus trituberculatus]